MDKLTQFLNWLKDILQSPTGYIILGLILLFILFIIFRKSIGRLIDRTTEAEISKGSVSVKAAKPISKNASTDQLKPAGSEMGGRNTEVNFGKENEFSGDWNNVAIGGDVTSDTDPEI
jgi:hypothetical protein